MKTFINNTTFAITTIATIAATFASAMTGSETQAQQTTLQQTQAAQNQYYVQPPVAPPVSPPATQDFYFGFSVQLVRGYGGTTLRLVSVTPGSPAQQAGLEVGDEIRTVNGQGFSNANNSFQAVRMLSQFVKINPIGGPAPAVAASAQTYYVSPPVQPSPVANMVVRNVRNGYDVAVTVRPTPKGWGGGGVAAAASQLR